MHQKLIDQGKIDKLSYRQLRKLEKDDKEKALLEKVLDVVKSGLGAAGRTFANPYVGIFVAFYLLHMVETKQVTESGPFSGQDRYIDGPFNSWNDANNARLKLTNYSNVQIQMGGGANAGSWYLVIPGGTASTQVTKTVARGLTTLDEGEALRIATALEAAAAAGILKGALSAL